MVVLSNNEPEKTPKKFIDIEIEESKIKHVKFLNHTFFGNMEFENIEMLNVITGPNGVGKSFMMKEIENELKPEWIAKEIFQIWR